MELGWVVCIHIPASLKLVWEMLCERVKSYATMLKRSLRYQQWIQKNSFTSMAWLFNRIFGLLLVFMVSSPSALKWSIKQWWTNRNPCGVRTFLCFEITVWLTFYTFCRTSATDAGLDSPRCVFLSELFERIKRLEMLLCRHRKYLAGPNIEVNHIFDNK